MKVKLKAIKDSPIGRGWGFAVGILGFVAASFALFNFTIDLFDLPLSPLMEPIARYYQLIFHTPLQWLAQHIPWSAPPWSNDITVWMVIILSLLARAGDLYSSIEDPESDNIGPNIIALLALVAFITLLFVPWLRWISVALFAFLVFSVLQSAFEDHEDTDQARFMIAYFAGSVLGSAGFLFVNFNT